MARVVTVAVRTADAAGLGAGAQRLVDDGLDGARAAAAFGAAAEAAVDLLGIARKSIRGADSTADIVVAKDVTGTDNHSCPERIGINCNYRYLGRPKVDFNQNRISLERF